MSNRWTLIIFSIGIAAVIYRACAQQDSFNEGNCTLTCRVTTNGTKYTWSWDYFTTSEQRYIGIYDGVQLSIENDTYTSSLTLDDYNAGTYECRFYFDDLPHPSFSAKLKISMAKNGADLYETCTEDHDCNTMHATCAINNANLKVCQCTGQYNITNGEYNLACLKIQPEGGHCFTEMECERPTQSYSCVNSECKCLGQKVEVNVDGTETEMCLTPAYLYGSCNYDEQCELTTEHSYCNHNGYGYCDCQDGYSYGTDKGDSYTVWYCYYNPLSGWKKAGVIIGIFFGSVILVFTILYIGKKVKSSCH